MNNPAVSIIIPVYNVDKYLRRCIDSVLSQSFTDFELILVDDGSKDTSPQLCDEYSNKDSRIRVIHKSNGGVSAARNDGLYIAKGEYVTFIDADDWVEEGYLEILLDYSQYDIVFFSYRMIYEDGYFSEYVFTEKEGNARTMWNIVASLKANASKSNFYGYTWNKMFRKEIIDKYGIKFINGLRISEDEVYTLDYCTHANSIKVLPFCLYNYRILGSGLTATRNSTDEYEKLAESYMAILQREKQKDLDRIYMPDVADCLYNVAFGQNNLLLAYMTIKRMKMILASFPSIQIRSVKIRIVNTVPLFLGLMLWSIIRVKIRIIRIFMKNI